MNEKWFGLQIDQIERKLKTNAASGLSRKAARSRAAKNSGELFYIPRRSPLRILGELLADFALIILLLLAVISLFFDEFRTAFTVLLISCLNLLVSWWIYYRIKRTSEALESYFYPTARVIRGGKLYYVDYRSVVVGDVILAEAGDVICCDARLVRSDSLSVRMRVDRESFITLQKHAEGHVRPNEHRASEMVNMLHAGSVIESGSARAIVTATGKYTYLGAMTGGIVMPVNEKAPDILKSVKKISSKINMILLIAVLPFTLISLILSHLDGGTVLLSSAFLTALAIVATTASQMICTLLKFFYMYHIKRLTVSADPTVVRSIDALDKLESVDYLFVLDGASLTDGILHFQAAACAGGEIRNYSDPDDSESYLCDMVSLYYSAATRTLTTGIGGAENYLSALREFISHSKTDSGATNVRCSVVSYSPADLKTDAETVRFTDKGAPFTLYVSRSPQMLSSCTHMMYKGEKCALTSDGAKRLESMWSKYSDLALTPIAFYVSEGHISSTDMCFVGILVLREGTDTAWAKNISRLERACCKVILFDREISDAPRIPEFMMRDASFSKRDFTTRNLPITAYFGKIKSYRDLDNEDIVSLIDAVRSKGKRVAVLGFDETAADIAKRSDCFISCAPVRAVVSGFFDQEVHTSELTGHQNSTSCSQTVKERADCIIPRPQKGKGGLASVVRVFLGVKTAYKNILGFLRYTMCTQLLRIPIVAIPMVLGKATLDARHVVFCAFVLDMLALVMFATKINHGKEQTARFDSKNITERLFGDRVLIISSLAASISTLLLPELFGLTGIADMYHDKVEVSFTALILLHVVALFVIYINGNLRLAKKAFTNKIFIGELAFSVFFLLICYLWKDLGAWFNMEHVPSLPYFILAVLPSVIFVALIIVLPELFKRTESKKQAKM